MYFIDATPHPYFQNLAKVMKHHLQGESQIFQPGVNHMMLRGKDPNATYILNYVSFKNEVHKQIPWAKYIAVQTEQLNVKGKPDYLAFLKNAVEVWDWTTNMQFGYSDMYRLESEDGKDIDVLFYGTMNSRRLDTLNKLKCNVEIVVNKYGAELWKYIHRSKIILSIHYYDKPDNDWPRIAPLLSDGCFVICEETVDEKFNMLNKQLVIVSKEKIPETVEHYLANPLERLEWARIGRDYVKYGRPHINNTNEQLRKE